MILSVGAFYIPGKRDTSKNILACHLERSKVFQDKRPWRRPTPMRSLTLPRQDGSLEQYRLTGTPIERPQTPPTFNRIAYAAAHVVSDPLRDLDPWGNPAIDWDATMAFRHHLWGL